MWVFEQTPDTFYVEEELIYPLDGEGGHVYARVRKRGISTQDAKRRLAAHLGVPENHISHAGKKDTRATAVQWLSWPENLQRTPVTDLDGIEVLEEGRHRNGLGLGHVALNHFRLRLTGSGPLPEEAAAAAPFPNFYGRQRFGRDVANTRTPRERFRGTRRHRDDVAVLQSYLFNRFLAHRLQLDDIGRADDERWTNSNGKRCFEASIDAELQARIDAGEVVPTGPVFGYKVKLRAQERAFLAEQGLDAEGFRRFGKMAMGARRSLVVAPRFQGITRHADGVELQVALPSGAYATVYLIHLFQPDALRAPESAWPNFTEPVALDGHIPA